MGKPGIAFLLAHGWHSVSDLLVRSHTVYANLRQTSSSLERSSLYVGLDPTEKSGVSYFMGMIAAKILGARLFNTPWLFHLSMVSAVGGTVSVIGKSQPDLIGLRRNRDWVVVEAKGRTWSYSASAMSAAKSQTRQLRTVNGQFPSLRIAVQASFAPGLEWALEDPEEFDADAADLEFDVESALAMYYSASVAVTQTAQERVIDNREFMVRSLSDVGVTVGVENGIRERLASRTMMQADQVRMLTQSSEPRADGDFVVFPDGLAVSLDERWSEDRMTLDPGARRLE